MKKWEMLLGLLVVCVSVCGAADRFKFLSTLSAPIGSFSTLETKSNDPVVITEDAELNVGSAKSKGGKIALEGDTAMRMTNLWMEDGTTIKGGDNVNHPHWLVNNLTIYGEASVKVWKLIANTVSLRNTTSEQGATLEVSENLYVNTNGLWTKKGKATNLNVSWGDGEDVHSFNFSGDGSLTGTAEQGDDGTIYFTN